MMPALLMSSSGFIKKITFTVGKTWVGKKMILSVKCYVLLLCHDHECFIQTPLCRGCLTRCHVCRAASLERRQVSLCSRLWNRWSVYIWNLMSPRFSYELASSSCCFHTKWFNQTVQFLSEKFCFSPCTPCSCIWHLVLLIVQTFFPVPFILCICALHCVHPWTQLQKGRVLLRVKPIIPIFSCTLCISAVIMSEGCTLLLVSALVRVLHLNVFLESAASLSNVTGDRAGGSASQLP